MIASILDVVLKEIKTVSKFMESESIICMDDANYNFKHTNTAFINLTCKSLVFLQSKIYRQSFKAFLLRSQ